MENENRDPTEEGPVEAPLNSESQGGEDQVSALTASYQLSDTQSTSSFFGASVSFDPSSPPQPDGPHITGIPAVVLAPFVLDTQHSRSTMSQGVLAQFNEHTRISGGAAQATPAIQGQVSQNYFGAVGATAQTDLVDVTINQVWSVRNGQPALLPADQPQDFYVFVNGVLREIAATQIAATDTKTYEVRLDHWSSQGYAGTYNWVNPQLAQYPGANPLAANSPNTYPSCRSLAGTHGAVTHYLEGYTTGTIDVPDGETLHSIVVTISRCALPSPTNPTVDNHVQLCFNGSNPTVSPWPSKDKADSITAWPTSSIGYQAVSYTFSASDLAALGVTLADICSSGHFGVEFTSSSDGTNIQYIRCQLITNPAPDETKDGPQNAFRSDQATPARTHLADRTFRLQLKEPLKSGDTVEVTYISDTSSSQQVTDNTGGSPNNLPSFYGLSTLNQTRGTGDSILDWLDGVHTEPYSDPTWNNSVSFSGSLVEQRSGYDVASIILDINPPSGMAILNENPDAGGIQVFVFQASNGTALVPGTLALTDYVGQVTDNPSSLPSSATAGTSITIGESDVVCLQQMFSPTSNVYPTISYIEFCATAQTPKSIVVEVLRTTGDWTPVVNMIANTLTLSVYKYTLNTSIPLMGVRLRHGGDFYSSQIQGTLTLAARDLISGTAAVQVSRFADMRDAADFPSADANGWAPFTDGVSDLQWNLMKPERLWSPQRGRGLALTPVSAAGATNAYFTSGVNLYSFGSSGLSLITTSTLGNITSICEWKGDVYVGTDTPGVYLIASGIMERIDGGSCDAIPASMQSFQGDLYIVTKQGADGNARVFAYDGTNFTLVRTIANLDALSTAVANNLLFVGTGGAMGSGIGSIFYFNGSTWTASRQTNADRVDALGYATGLLWAGTSGGILQTLSFDSSGNPTTWTIPPQTSSASIYYSIIGSSDQTYAWFVGDTGSMLYIPNSSGGIFATVDPPPTYPNGLSGYFLQSTQPTVKEIGIGAGAHDTTAETQVNNANLVTYANGLSNAVTGPYFNASWTGFIRAEETGDHTFYLKSAGGARLYLGGDLVSNVWTDGTLVVNNFDYPSATERRGSLSLIAGQLVPFRVEYYHESGAGSIALKWGLSGQFNKELIPSRVLYTSGTSNGTAPVMAAALTSEGIVFAGSDGRVYTYDQTTFLDKRRRVYARFRDAAGNATAVTSAGSVIGDMIIQGSETINGVQVSAGQAYQINQSRQVVASFASPTTGGLYAINRSIQVTGAYESLPYYASNLSRWDAISFLATIPPAVAQDGGLQSGTQVNLLVRTADDRDTLLATDWGAPYSRSSIPPNNQSGTINTATTGDFNIESLSGKWIQFRLELVTAQRGATPTVTSVTLSYRVAQSTYFFTELFDLTQYTTDSIAPQIRRVISTLNSLPNGGKITMGYTTNTDPAAAFDFDTYTPLPPNQLTALPAWSSTIRFGIELQSIDEDNPAKVDDFAILFDAGDARNLDLMG